MKVSLKLDDHQQNLNSVLFNAKIPIDVFGVPFLSAISATHHHSSTASDKLSLSLHTYFPSGPSLKLSYNTPITTPSTATSTAAVSTATAPFTLTLKSGVSLSGSPNNSPLTISANFSFSPQNPNPNPNFSIHFKPKLGSFSFSKSIPSIVSNPSTNLNGDSTNGGENSSAIWKVESTGKNSILSGILMLANTELPVSKRVKVNLRWGLNIPSDYEKQLPYMRLNKIKLQRIDDANEENVNQKQGIEGEFKVLKGEYSWMRSELNDLRKENREMRVALEEINSWQPLKNCEGNSEGFEHWRMRKKKGQRDSKKNGSLIDLESDLQKEIKTASSQ